MKYILIKRTAMIALALLMVVGMCACDTEATTSVEVGAEASSTASVQPPSQETNREEPLSSHQATEEPASSVEDTSSTESTDVISEETSSPESEVTSSDVSKETSSETGEETLSEENKETSSKEAPTVKACEHNYVRAHSPWDYVEGRSWDGRGWAPEKDGILYSTCTEQGMLVEVCSICNDVKLSNFVAPLGHECEWMINSLPTPTKTGVLAYQCTRCYKDQKTEPIPKRPGDYSKIDSRMSIKESARSVVFEYAHLYIIDRRSWGAPPEIQVLDVDHAYIIYYTKDGQQMTINEKMKPGGYDTLMITIDEDGKYYVSNILPLDID